MMRYQNNTLPAATGRMASRDQSAWAGEIGGGQASALPNGGPVSMEVAPGSAGTMGRPGVLGVDGRPLTGGRLQMQNNLPEEVVESPVSLEEARLGSLKAMLARNVGNYIVATFLVGTQNMVSWEGILYDVGNDYLTIYQESRDRYIVSDFYSLKFMEFYDTERRELCNSILEQNGWSPSMG